MRKIAIGLGLVSVVVMLAAVLDAQDGAKAPAIKVEVVGLSVVKPAKPAKTSGGFASMNMDEGTQIKLRASVAGMVFLGLDEDASKVKSFTDEKGTDLSKPDPAEVRSSSFSAVSEDGTT